MHLTFFLAQQKQDFIRAFLSAHYPVGIQNPSDLSRFMIPSATWRWDPAFATQKAFIRTVEGQHKEYWIDVNENRYRDAFKGFLQTEYNVPRESITQALHADHMLNKAFAQRHGLRFVRMAIVLMAYNQGWGGKIEKLLTRAMARDNSIYRFDYFIFMKVLNILPPADEADYRARRTAIAQQLCAETGLSISILLQGLDGIFTLWDVL
jgi:hypothetical protein